MSVGGFHLRAAGRTDIGHRRADNEDAFFVDEQLGLLIVSDGMGGRNAGGTASQAVVRILPKVLKSKLTAKSADVETLAAGIAMMIADLSVQLCSKTAGIAGFMGLGATVALACFWERKLIVEHAGDSRAYLLRSGRIRRLTDDHSVAELLLRDGTINSAEARTHPARNTLTRYIGMEGHLTVDVTVNELELGDRLLLCTDGVTRGTDDDTLVALLTHRRPVEACDALIAAANQRGGVDNSTAVVADVTETASA